MVKNLGNTALALRMKIKRLLLYGIVFLLAGSLCQADEKFIFDPHQSNIQGSIHYSVIGVYKARFLEFQGEARVDQKTGQVSSVLLKIKVDSLRSRFPKLDRIITSKRLLDAKQSPEIIFQSQSIQKRGESYTVTGIVDMHGIKRTIVFPFELNYLDANTLVAQGKWLINRKDFDIIWHKILDRGGIIVGNQITVDWKLTAQKG